MTKVARLLSVGLLAFLLSGPVCADCRLPVPDDGEERPSHPNLTGRISKVMGNDVLVRQDRTGRLVRVRLPKDSEIYTAFGGDGTVSDLAPGQAAKVWFQSCVWPKAKVPVSAYFQIYSRDPKDQPDAA